MRRLVPFLTAAWVIAVVASVTFVIASSYPPVREARARPGKTGSLEALVNGVREKAGKPALRDSGELDSLAAGRCRDLEASGTMSHAGFQPMFDSQSVFNSMGENLAEDYPDESGAVAGWVESPKHYADMTGSWEWTGTAECGRYYVQLFANFQA